MFIAVDTELHQAFGPFDSEEQAKTWLKRMQPTRTVDPDYWTFYEVEYVEAEDEDDEPKVDNPFDSAYGGGSYSSHPNL